MGRRQAGGDYEELVEEPSFTADLLAIREKYPLDSEILKDLIDWTLGPFPEYGKPLKSDPRYRTLRIPGFMNAPEYRVLYRFCRDDPHPRVQLIHISPIED